MHALLEDHRRRTAGVSSGTLTLEPRIQRPLEAATSRRGESITIKYLRVTIDAWLSFKHLLDIDLKASKVARAPADTMLNIGGLKEPRWALLSSAVLYAIFYESEVWADTLHSNWTEPLVDRSVVQSEIE